MSWVLCTFDGQFGMAHTLEEHRKQKLNYITGAVSYNFLKNIIICTLFKPDLDKVSRHPKFQSI